MPPRKYADAPASADTVVASIQIRRAGAMTPRARRQIAAWLHKQAEDLEVDGHAYAAQFRARYHTLGS
jgi:hypothetical protein